ncbi:SMC-Scp complex subunit ScpB [Mycoplasmopsis agassizii]|uniref:Segregation and condensation protein B n=1 Tax=Mycoplasmopsis agassizii TaxID=33922 RepID=A0A1W1X2B7_9BACT|nr:SMC-Scp complex subunit ScpB [Mycoplasmopsis agassizii]PAF55499.1 segregation/condensation protein B [Mycoplasmopsis agassizii]PAK21554.1 segregation/condensation protein B [Mycoplasmopsis agassizii]SMC18054.1 segregation and condensation protein B [Mycoplasmopsis agassizii]
MNNYSRIIEALAYVQGEEGVSVEQVKKVLNFDSTTDDEDQFNTKEALKLLRDFKEQYNALNLGTKVFEFNEVFKIATAESMKDYIGKLVSFNNAQKLSKAALETVGIVAYKQPVTRSLVSEIRGVSSDQVFNTLLVKGLIEEVGIASTPGNPILYGVTNRFYDYFKIKSLHDLPRLQEFEFLDVEMDNTQESNFSLYQSQREE